MKFFGIDEILGAWKQRGKLNEGERFNRYHLAIESSDTKWTGLKCPYNLSNGLFRCSREHDSRKFSYRLQMYDTHVSLAVLSIVDGQ